MYVCVCHTCEEGISALERGPVQEFFDDHADGRHRVVLERVDSTAGTVAEAAIGAAAGDDASRPESDGAGRNDR
ncbi:MAG: hypothetical protein ABEJ26_01070 [Halosimplex sp.]